MSGAKGAGHRRRNLALVVVAASVLSAGVGVVLGRRLQSPADAAAEAAAPEPSRITVPVERRSLVSRLVANGEVQFNEPTPLRLAGSVGASAGATQVVTKVPELDRELHEGDVALEVSGRPVFVFAGALPTYRPFEPGTTGPDVQQLEEALLRLGFDPGTVDGVYDNATESAIDQLYTSEGYQSEGPTDEQRQRLRSAEKAMADAKQGVTRARQERASAGKPLSGAELVRQQQALQAARDAVPAAQASATRRNADAGATVVAATSARDIARSARDAAKTARDAAAAPGAINPDTGVDFTAAEIAVLSNDLLTREQALGDAEAALRRAVSERDQTALDADAAIATAADALLLAQLTYNEAVAPKDVSLADDAVDAAVALLDQAAVELFTVASQVGTKMPAGEMIFLPSLPTTITQVSAEAGKQPADPVATVSGTSTLVQGRIAAADADLVKVPTPVDIVLQDADIVTTGTLVEIKKPEPDPTNGEGGDGAGRLTIVVEPDDPALLAQYVGFPARISVTVSSTAGDVLAVPVAALTVGPDGESRVEVERDTADGPVAVEFVKVTVGLSAEGYAEVKPIAGGSLDQGDRVVVGRDSGTRRRRSDTSNDTSNDTSDTGGGGSG